MNMNDDVLPWLKAALDTEAARIGSLRHVTADLDVDSETYACPGSRSGPVGDLPWGEQRCTCGLVRRRAERTARLQAERAILALFHGDAIPDPFKGGYEITDDDAWGALGAVLVWIAWGRRHDVPGWREEWTPYEMRASTP